MSAIGGNSQRAIGTPKNFKFRIIYLPPPATSGVSPSTTEVSLRFEPEHSSIYHIFIAAHSQPSKPTTLRCASASESIFLKFVVSLYRVGRFLTRYRPNTVIRI